MKMAAKKQIDWEAIERDYRAGIKSLRVIATQHQITDGAIRDRAKRYSWQRDLTEKVRKAARAQLLRGATQSDTTQATTRVPSPQKEEEIVNEAAEVQVAIIREHRKDIARGRRLTLRLMDELDATTSHLGELSQLIESSDGSAAKKALDKIASLSSRVGALFNLSVAAKNWMGMERQAFNINDDFDGDDDDGNATVKTFKIKFVRSHHVEGAGD